MQPDRNIKTKGSMLKSNTAPLSPIGGNGAVFYHIYSAGGDLMAKKKPIVTNAMRILKAEKISFETVEYEADREVPDHFGERTAEKTGIPSEQSFKTLVARGDKTGIIAILIPVADEVDLKKLASASGNKRVELIHVKELFELTGYIRGGVSPIGMKKKYPTYIEKSCMDFEKIAVSAGTIGCTLLLSPNDLRSVCGAELFDNGR